MGKKILFIINVDWFFISHRLPIAIKAMADGYEVHLACGVTDKKVFLEDLGIQVHPITMRRSGTVISEEFRVLHELWHIVKKVDPDVSHVVTIKGVIYGGIITRLLKIKSRVASISGLGYVFIDNSIKARVLKYFIIKFYRFALGVDTRVIFQNKNDESLFVDNNIIKATQSILIRGSGVDLNRLKYTPEPTKGKIVMFLARLLKDKGLVEFCNAADSVKKITEARFVLVGDLDPHNPNSISGIELSEFVNKGAVEHWGHSKNIELIIPQSNIMVLPSYREGLPKTLLEAAACGRAIVTTDVPGCRDAITPDETGLLVRVKDVDDLAQAILKLLNDQSLRTKFGESGRRLAEKHFNIDDVVNKHMEIYRGKC